MQPHECVAMPRTTEVISHTCADNNPFKEPKLYCLSRKEERYTQLASEEAHKSIEHKARHGAVLVVNGKVVSKGYNRGAATKRDFSRQTTTHAEAAAVIQFIRRMSRRYSYSKTGGSLYIVRISCDLYCLSKPCNACTPFLESIPFVKEVIYSNGNNEFYKMKK